MAKERAYPIRADVIERLREARGLSVAKLAEKAGIDAKTLKRILSGGKSYLETVRRIATALHTAPDELRADLQPSTTGVTNRFSLSLGLQGEFKDPNKLRVLVELTPKIIAILAENGIKVDEHKTSLNIEEYAGNELRRIIVLVYGILATGKPFWAFVAVKYYMHSLFLDDEKNGAIDLTEFEPYGEVITFDEGTHPSDEVSLKVAELYQTDPSRFLFNVHNDIVRAMPILLAALNAKPE